MNLWRLLRVSVDSVLMMCLVLFILTGFGITDYHAVETFTFSLLTKPTSQMIHMNLIVPFLIFLFLHIVTTKMHVFKRWLRKTT